MADRLQPLKYHAWQNDPELCNMWSQIAPLKENSNKNCTHCHRSLPEFGYAMEQLGSAACYHCGEMICEYCAAKMNVTIRIDANEYKVVQAQGKQATDAYLYAKAKENGAVCLACGSMPAMSGKDGITMLRKYAREGKSHAQLMLGNWYSIGKDGLPKDYNKCVKWLTKAANNGEVSAQYQLADDYFKDHHENNVKKMSDEQAFYYTKKAANAGHIKAALRLGCCYEFGTGTDVCITSSRKWLNSSASAGHPGAIYLLGVSYVKNLPFDLQRAEKLLKDALQHAAFDRETFGKSAESELRILSNMLSKPDPLKFYRMRQTLNAPNPILDMTEEEILSKCKVTHEIDKNGKKKMVLNFNMDQFMSADFLNPENILSTAKFREGLPASLNLNSDLNNDGKPTIKIIKKSFRCRLVNLKDNTELNGKVGVCLNYDSKKGRHKVVLDNNGKSYNVKSDNIEEEDKSTRKNLIKEAHERALLRDERKERNKLAKKMRAGEERKEAEIVLAAQLLDSIEELKHLKKRNKKIPCGHCNKLSTHHSACSGCQAVYFCNKSCQHAHWKMGHKRVCKIIQKMKDEQFGFSNF
jgi:TPR repeat protein